MSLWTPVLAMRREIGIWTVEVPNMEVCGKLHSLPLAAVQVANPSRQLEEFAEMRLETVLLPMDAS